MKTEKYTIPDVTEIAGRAKKRLEKIDTETIKVSELDLLYDCVTDMEFMIDDFRKELNKREV
ncbi:MAG: hypothetical protein LBT46_15285 [Planctomycetaceae bacterium]|jgi:hypothetical protein|nr:hypothetical protein [Planctomycetaceae bacterium]